MYSKRVYIHVPSNEMLCLADNIYYEAAAEPFVGKLAVAIVTINRVASPKFPNSVCKVVYQKGQFSWTNSVYAVKDYNTWIISFKAAKIAMENPNIIEGFRATHYHNLTVNPPWAKKLVKVTRINNHIFYMV